jgi:hypothetical protein
MAITYVATSIADGIPLGAVAVNTTSGNMSAYVAENIFLPTETGGSNFFYLDLPAGMSEIWVAFDMKQNGFSGGNEQNYPIALFNKAYSTITPLFGIHADGNGDASVPQVYYNGSSEVKDGRIASFDVGGSIYRYDFHVKIGDTGGIIETYRAGVQVAVASITDTKYTSATTVDRVRFCNPSRFHDCWVSSIIVADEDTRAMVLSQVLPTGNGTDTAWTGSYTDVDETGINDADMITATTTGQEETYTFPALNSTFNTSYDIVAVAGSYRGAKGTGSLALKGKVRTNSSGDVLAMSPNYQFGPVQAIWALNPITTAAWTFSEASGSEVGVKVV